MQDALCMYASFAGVSKLETIPYKIKLPNIKSPVWAMCIPRCDLIKLCRKIVRCICYNKCPISGHVLFTLFHLQLNPIVISWNSLEPWRAVHSHSEIVQILHNNHSSHLKNELEWDDEVSNWFVLMLNIYLKLRFIVLYSHVKSV